MNNLPNELIPAAVNRIQHENGVVLVHGSELVPRPIQWLWDDWIALGKLHILAGDPGTGKTTIAMGLSAVVTSGMNWPDGGKNGEGNVLIWSGEDDYADTLLPRLLSAGAKIENVYFVRGSRKDGVIKAFDPAKNIEELRTEINRIGKVRLIIIDPIVSAITGDSHKNSETRRDLQPLVDLAASTGAALIGITHLSKGGSSSEPVSRVLGSVAFTAVPRVVMIAAKVEDDDGNERHLLVRGKSNIGPDGDGFEYTIDRAELQPGIIASLINWGEPVFGSTRELMGMDSDDDELRKKRSAKAEAAKALTDLLANGPIPAVEVYALAEAKGIKPRTLRRAADELGIIKRPGPDGRWIWALPDHLATSIQQAKMDNMDNIGSTKTFEDVYMTS